MTWAENLCKDVKLDIKEQAVTLANAVSAMQKKIEQQIPVYANSDLAQEVTVGTGETMLRQNPVVQEFRATVKDYSTALNNLQDILSENKSPTSVSDMSELRKKFKIAK
jgi:hypothetical protein